MFLFVLKWAFTYLDRSSKISSKVAPKNTALDCIINKVVYTEEKGLCIFGSTGIRQRVLADAPTHILSLKKFTLLVNTVYQRDCSIGVKICMNTIQINKISVCQKYYFHYNQALCYRSRMRVRY